MATYQIIENKSASLVYGITDTTIPGAELDTRPDVIAIGDGATLRRIARALPGAVLRYPRVIPCDGEGNALTAGNEDKAAGYAIDGEITGIPLGIFKRFLRGLGIGKGNLPTWAVAPRLFPHGLTGCNRETGECKRERIVPLAVAAATLAKCRWKVGSGKVEKGEGPIAAIPPWNDSWAFGAVLSYLGTEGESESKIAALADAIDAAGDKAIGLKPEHVEAARRVTGGRLTDERKAAFGSLKITTGRPVTEEEEAAPEQEAGQEQEAASQEEAA